MGSSKISNSLDDNGKLWSKVLFFYLIVFAFLSLQIFLLRLSKRLSSSLLKRYAVTGSRIQQHNGAYSCVFVSDPFLMIWFDISFLFFVHRGKPLRGYYCMSVLFQSFFHFLLLNGIIIYYIMTRVMLYNLSLVQRSIQWIEWIDYWIRLFYNL